MRSRRAPRRKQRNATATVPWFSKAADSLITWAVLGAAIGLGLGLVAISAALVALGIFGWMYNVSRHNPEAPGGDRLPLAGPIFIVAWVLAFTVHGIAGI